MKFLKPQVGSGHILEDCPALHFPDFGNVSTPDIFAGPLNVTPHDASKFVVENY